MTKQELTQKYEQTCWLINKTIQHLLDLKTKATADYEEKLLDINEAYPEDAKRSMRDFHPCHPDNN